MNKRNFSSITHTNCHYVSRSDKFSVCKAEEGDDAVASLTDDNAADGNLAKRKVWIISVGYTSVLTRS